MPLKSIVLGGSNRRRIERKVAKAMRSGRTVGGSKSYQALN